MSLCGCHHIHIQRKYLAEQLDSILAQDNVRVELFIRDDGSKDGTRNILEDYARRYANIHVSSGENLGPGMSFITELKTVSGFEYYAFSDQDDFWEKDKLISALRFISLNTTEHDNMLPILYCSNLYEADENLNLIRTTNMGRLKHNLESVITRRNLSGCTMVFNEKLHNLVMEAEVTQAVLGHYHDSLLESLCLSLGGKILFDAEAHIYQREHRGNTSGVHATRNIFQRIRKELQHIRRGRGAEPETALWLMGNFGDRLTPEARKTLELVASCRDSIISRLKFVFLPKFSTGDFRLTIFGKAKMLFGLL